MADAALRELDAVFDEMYDDRGRRSVPPERLLKATLWMALFSVRSERQLCEQLDYNLLFRWFLDMDMLEGSFDHSVFARNRARLMSHDVAHRFMAAIVASARREGLLSAEPAAALQLLDRTTSYRHARASLGADKGYDTQAFVEGLRERNLVPHVAAKAKYSALDKRTTRHVTYALSQRVRKRVEEIFGWGKTIGGLRKTRYLGVARNDFFATMIAAAFNLVRLVRLTPSPG